MIKKEPDVETARQKSDVGLAQEERDTETHTTRLPGALNLDTGHPPRDLEVEIIFTLDGSYPFPQFRAYLQNPQNLSFPEMDAFTTITDARLDRTVSQDPNILSFAQRTKYFNLISGQKMT